MQFSTFITSTMLAASTLVSARCYGGSNQHPDRHVATIEAIMQAAYKMNQHGWIYPGGEVWSSNKVGNVCLNFGLKNQASYTQAISAEDAMDALAREWIGCEHGGETKYDTGLLMIFHMDC